MELLGAVAKQLSVNSNMAITFESFKSNRHAPRYEMLQHSTIIFSLFFSFNRRRRRIVEKTKLTLISISN